MKIRTQLILAFFVLAILPLTGIVLYSYWSSLDAVRAAVEEDGRALTEEMDERLATVRRDLDLRFASLAQVPFSALLADGDVESAEPLADRLVTVMGDAAPWIESLEFIPAPPAPPAPPEGMVAVTPREPRVPRVPGVAAIQAPSDDGQAVVIDVPRMLAEISLQVTGDDAEAAGLAQSGAAVGLAFEILGDLAADLQAEDLRLEARIDAAEAGLLDGDLTPEERAEIGRTLAESARARRAQRELALRIHSAVEAKRHLSDAERLEIERRQHEQSLLLGDEFQVPVEEDGEVVGHVKACVASRDVLKEILRASVRGEGEIPFAIDREGNLYTADDEGLAVAEELGIEASDEGGWRATGPAAEDWVLATSQETGSGLTFGIARPIRQSLAEVRRTAARNFAYGLGLIVLGLVGIQPLSRRMTRQLDTVTRGADRIARGDLQTRLPVESKSELGELSSAFNRMAAELSVHQERLVKEESRRKEHELQERLLLAEFRRKSDELEEARRFQLSLLPKEMPDHPGLDLAVAMTTATEVGGDFYDYSQGADGSLTLAVGDATGHGARAGTMVTVIKSLFSAWSASANGSGGPARFLEDANRAIQRMELGRMAMALLLARFDGNRLTLASAGMPPALVHRAGPDGGRVEEVVLSGMPLGGLDFAYCEHSIDLAPGDTMLLLSDGLCELPNAAGDPMGYDAVRDLFRDAAGRRHEELEQVIVDLEAGAKAWAGGSRQADDRTYAVVRVR
jgi:serine phosphatase RsbU (regulator of sigma subunit)